MPSKKKKTTTKAKTHPVRKPAARPRRVAPNLVETLRAAISGPVTGPDDAGYDAARQLFYRKFDRRPGAIAYPTNAADVAAVIGLARGVGLPLAVRGGGHSVAGFSTTDGGIVLNLESMKALEFDLPGRTAWAEAGLTAGEYTRAAGAHGLATGFGDTGTVGIGGLTLGGGIGFLARKFGLTIDDLLAAEIVTADGNVLSIDAQSHPDLFWAIRGGGGNFGVVTRFKFRLHELQSIIGGMLVLSGAPDVIAAFIAEALAAPDELSTIANVMKAPPMPFLPESAHGKPFIMALLAWSGDSAAGEAVLARLRSIAPPLADMLRPMRYPELYTMFGEETGPGPAQGISRSMFLNDVDRRTAEIILEHVNASTAMLAVAQLRVLGGALARVPADSTAFAHRSNRIMATLGNIYENADDTPVQQAWLDAFLAALDQGVAGAYSNFLEGDGIGTVRLAYPGQTYERLAEIKRRYDPTNLFRLNHNIAPA